MQAMFMDLYEAVTAIGEAIAACCPTGVDGEFELVQFPVPDQFYPMPGRPSVTIRFDGIANDDYNRYADMENPPKSPSDLRWEIRIYHTLDGPPAEEYTEDTDPYAYAQNQVLRGTSEFYKRFTADQSLGGLVLDVAIGGSITGDLIDPRTNTTYYGHEIIVLTSSY